ncbi:MAG: protein-methionine-sulfoxide reductase catalytic subunit MsrP [Acidobacteria bacterium]|nr:protein-methionine-sulfoxide reductase catalytic subunit MsrP [Acidobacteriota bacterium]MCW5950396.1 protein-methionine-sulfoxide reductase catalytic subunit MsrP [Pyrinomonadaceae bacterium]
MDRSDKNTTPDQITPEHVYLSRRNFIRAGVFAGSAFVTGSIYQAFRPRRETVETAPIENVSASSVGEQATPFEEIANYNNYYEFSTSKSGVASRAKALLTRPWAVTVDGAVAKPQTFDIEDILKIEQEERIYRFRCVEAWSMVVPWVGFPLAKLLAMVEPASNARYVAFTSHYDPRIMSSPAVAGIDLPYVEGLRLDEAMHPLTIMATGLYGKLLPNQNGAPLRLVVPWKYGFKSIKSVVKITLTENEPPTTWNIAAPSEYGFYSNVNPDVSHPRWSQKKERRLGETGLRDTLPFNGYGEEVAALYDGMDLRKYF